MMGGVDVGTISRWERDETTPSDAHLVAWAKAVGLEIDAVMKIVHGGNGEASGLRNVGTIEQLHDIPLYDLSSPASHWAEIAGAEDQTNEGDRGNKRAVDQGLFRIRIHGDCMAPKYPDGCIVEFKIWRNDSPFPLGKNVVITNSDGMSTFKHLAAVDEDTITLTALNKKKYPKPILLPAQMMSRLAVAVGRFVPEE